MIFVLMAFLVMALPRLSIIGLWFLTNWFEGVWNGLMWPILGFLFAPVTLIWYSVVINIFDGEWGWVQIVILVLAILIDLSPAKHKGKKK